MVKYRFIKTQRKLKELCEELEKHEVIAIDLECENNLHHYGSYISIIQISAGKKNWVVDVIELKEIKPLKEILENKKIQKIFHDVSFDFRILKSELGIEPKNLFDTQIAALLIGERNVGLASLLEKFFSVKKESKFQMADWTKRPINHDMISYAVKDTAYLIPLKNLLEQEIKKLGREEWLRQELEHLEQKDYNQKEFTFEDVKGVSKLEMRQKAFAELIYNEREKIAKKKDKPVHRIISNKKIINVVTNPLKKSEEWKNMKGVHPEMKSKLFEINKEVQRIKISPEPKISRERKNYTETQKQQLQELEDTRVKLGTQLGIEPYLIMSKDQVHETVRQKNYNTLRPWQKDLIKKETKLFQ